MSTNSNRILIGLLAACAMAALTPFTLTDAYAAGPRQVADTFTATTANMTPAGVTLRMQIIEWQEADARAEVVATLAANADTAAPLAKLPTVGYVWPNGSPVGYSVKYANRAPQQGGGERITLVTDRRLGSYDFKGWSATSATPHGERPYSVIVLDLNSSGTSSGDLSLAADVVIDE